MQTWALGDSQIEFLLAKIFSQCIMGIFFHCSVIKVMLSFNLNIIHSAWCKHKIRTTTLVQNGCLWFIYFFIVPLLPWIYDWKLKNQSLRRNYSEESLRNKICGVHSFFGLHFPWLRELILSGILIYMMFVLRRF